MSIIHRRPMALAAAAALLAACALSATPTPASAADATTDATVVPIQNTGPAEKRFNMVVLGDGYTADEMPEFRADVERHMNVLWSIEPFASYRSYINVWAVEASSAESGVDCDPGLDAPRRDTRLGMGFWGGCDANSVQRLLTVDSTAATAQADLVAGTTTANRQIVALGNSDTYGGAGGTYATASGGNALSSLITPHEIGHSLGKLQDEYDYYGRGEPGGAYQGGEPTSVHHTTLTSEQMADRKKKWWRWLGEESLSGGRIGTYEGGMYSTTGVWRPSKHSMMKTLGYAFDQVGREAMVKAISGKVNLIQDHTPNSAPVAADRSVFVDTLHPVGGELDTVWRLDGKPVAHSVRSLDLKKLGIDLGRGKHKLTATVTDPTPFVRDPEIRGSEAMTRSVEWTLDGTLTTEPDATEARFTHHTATDTPVGARSVIHADTTHPATGVPRVRWAVDGKDVANPGNDRDLDLGALRRTPRTVTARTGDDVLTWTVDTKPADTSYELSAPLRTVKTPGRPTRYVYDGPFTMKLTGRDDQEGAVVSQFRVNGDGWHTYYGWPTDPDAPFRFTPEGTVIDDLVYGKLGDARAVPWDDPTPRYGTHTIEYRSIDAAGNIAAARKFEVTLAEKQG
ncbi:M64 family metallopeptidase [Streptomyces sp. BH097]|uniref:M64 family metallopeptidase n=1 Tax=unclassified Streptomyces TaxID=2593676 RepID=UPI003BB6ED39